MIPARSRPDEMMVYDPETSESLTTLLSRLSRETTQLVVQETALARTELEAKFAEAKRGAVVLATSSVVLLAGLIVLLFAAAYGIGTVLPVWAGFLIVGTVVIGTGAVLALLGARRLNPERLRPKQTQSMLQKDKEFIQEQF